MSPRTITLRDSGSRAPLVIWNVDQPVGAGKPNLDSDVRLVQVFLTNIYDSILRSPRTDDGDVPGLEINGRCTDATLFCILRFQRDNLGRVLPDGVVDSVPLRGQAVASISRTTYTIIVLNEKFSGVPTSVPALIAASRRG
jgi:hypothetical protein